MPEQLADLLEGTRVSPRLIARAMVASAALEGEPLTRKDILALASHQNDIAVELLKLADPGRA